MRVEYRSNNSGGHWWLKDEDWKNLELVGWEVAWRRNSSNEFSKPDKDGRYMGALATSATRYNLGLEDSVVEWETATGLSSTEAGCPCCGQPHNFSLYDDKENYVKSGPDIVYQARW